MYIDSKTTPPEVLSMDVDGDDLVESEYRIRIDNEVKYLTVDPGLYGGDILSFPPDLFNHLPSIPNGTWTRARIYKSFTEADAQVEFLYEKLHEVAMPWHPNFVDILSLKFEERYKVRVRGVWLGSISAVAKYAGFSFELPSIEKETQIYQMLRQTDFAPAFLGHLTENGRVIGFLLEKVEGRRGEIADIESCKQVVRKLHALGIVHRDLNRYNFIVSSSGVKLIDFEVAQISDDHKEMDAELAQLADRLVDESKWGTISAVTDSDSE